MRKTVNPRVRISGRAQVPEATPLRGVGVGESRYAMVIRRGGRQDVRFLRDMLHHAYYWRERDPGKGPGPVARYVKGWGKPGDTALIAVDDGFPVGAAWYRLFTREHPGYGFVDEETPELAIAVVPNRRGRGLGEALLDALVERARGTATGR